MSFVTLNSLPNPRAAVGALLVASLLVSVACGDTASSGTAAPDASDKHDAGSTTVTHDAGKDAAKHDAVAASEAGHVDAGHADAGATVDAALEAEAGPPRDHGDASSVYPAFTPDVPMVQDQGGPTLATPQIVTITWPGDPNATALEAFADDIGTSAYWAATTSEYGVGPAVSGPSNHVRLTEAPITSWSDTALATWITGHAQQYATYGFPAPNRSVIYTMYLSASTDITVGGTDACQEGVGGYHSSVVVDGFDVAYAVIIQCQGAELNSATEDASHELVEAVTDPHPNDIAAYYGFDAAHLAWDVFQQFQDEVADACEFYYGPNGSFYLQPFSVVEPADAGVDGGDAGLLLDAGSATYKVQRTWSNAQATAGHAPCVPAVAGPYYSVTPLGMVPIALDLTPIGSAANAQTLGYAIKLGETKTFAVGFHSDGPTSGPWTISVSEGNPLFGGSQSSHLTMSIDVPQGQNGDISYITVKVNEVDTSMNGELVTIESQLGTGARTFVPILISNE